MQLSTYTNAVYLPQPRLVSAVDHRQLQLKGQARLAELPCRRGLGNRSITKVTGRHRADKK